MTSLLTDAVGAVVAQFGGSAADILAPKRGPARHAYLRAIAMYVYRCAEPAVEPTLTEVGRAFGRDRTTVRHALARVDTWRRESPTFRAQLTGAQQALAAQGYPGGVQ